MKCFHFSIGHDKKHHHNTINENSNMLSRSSTKASSWARSLSASFDKSRRRSDNNINNNQFDDDDHESNSTSREFGDHNNSNMKNGFSEMMILKKGGGGGNKLRVFTFSELKNATKGFSRSLVIGEGGFGCVYRGLVADASLDVAVKQLSRNGFQGHKEWINEVNFLGVVNHPNLVKLVGYCAEDDERGIQRLLVYELMRNKSLEDHLLGRVESTLSWITRLQIAQGAARGLAYLHEEMDFQLIFRDFKTSNILLDEDFNPKLSDFGLARQGPAAGLGHVSTAVVGTVGYAAPEYLHTGRLTSKSDVWSFGVVLYELMTGRRAVERNLPRNEQKLLEWVKPYVSDSKKFHLLMDPRLEGDYSLKSAQKLSSLASKCLTKNPKSRPKMSEVVKMLGHIINDLSPTKGETEIETETEPEPESRFVTEENEEVKQEIISRNQEPNGINYMKKVFDLKDLRNRSVGRLDWRHWPSGMVKHTA